MRLYETLNIIYDFLVKLKIQIKLLPNEMFYQILSDKSLDYTQRLYLICFRYM